MRLPEKIVIFSNAPWASSAYAGQTAIFAKAFQSLGIEVVVAAFYGLEGSPLGWDGIRVLPCRLPEEQYSAKFLAEHAAREKPDLVLTLCDIWVLDPPELRRMPLAHWVPVDCSRLGKGDARVLREGGGIPVAMSRHGERCLTEAGFSPLYAPHGLHPLYRDSDVDRSAARAGAGLAGKFIIGINAANQDNYRKGFFEQFEAFSRFHARHPDSHMLVHAAVSMHGGLNLSEVAEECGITGKVSFSEPYDLLTGLYKPVNIRTWYGSVDLYSGCSMGEGFGIPVVEAQASGVPVVVTDASAQTELCGAGWKVKGEPLWNATHAARWVKPYIGDIDRAYEKAWRLWSAAAEGDGRWARLQAQARTFAEPYHSDRVLREHWEPVLAELQRRLHPPVALTRAGTQPAPARAASLTGAAMKVAWVAGHDLAAIGGAEMSDRAFIEHASLHGASVDVFTTVPPPGYDRVVVSRADMLTLREADGLAAMGPVVLAHGCMRAVAPHHKELFESARLFFAVSPRHLEAEQQWLGEGPQWAVTPTWFDTTGLHAQAKEDFALWPHRQAWHKDLGRAQEWAAAKGVELVVMHDRPQAEVHAAMCRARWVVLFSKDVPEPGNRAVQEGYIAGCEPVIDDWVWSLSWGLAPEELRAAVDSAPATFWERTVQS